MAERSPMTPEEEHALRIAMWQAEEAEGVEERDALEAEVERLREALHRAQAPLLEQAGEALAWHGRAAALEAENERLRRVLDAIVIAFPDTAGAVAWEVLEGGGE